MIRKCWGRTEIERWERKALVERVCLGVGKLAWWTLLFLAGYAAAQVIGGGA